MFRIQKGFAAVLMLTFFVGFVSAVLAAEARGRIASIRLTKNELILTESFNDLTFQVNNNTPILLNGQSSKLADLRPGDEAAVTYDRAGEKLIATMVACVRRKAGTVSTADSESRRVNLLNSGSAGYSR